MNKAELNRIFLNAVSLSRVRSHRGKGAAESWEDFVASGVDYLRISNAKANSLSSLIVGGGCSQSGTPAPTAPVPIICNKGTVSYGVLGKNLLEVKDDNIVVGKYINNAGVVTTSLPNLYFQRFVSVKPSTAYTLSTSETLNYANFMEYDADGVFIKRTLYGSSGTPAGKVVTHTMGENTAFVIVGSNVNGTKYPEISKADVMAIKWMFCEGSSAKTYEAYRAGYSYGGEDGIKVYGKNLSVGELVGKGYASTGGVSTSSTFCGNLHKIPCASGQIYTISWGNLPDGLSGVFINTWKTDGTWNLRQAISASGTSLKYTIPSGVGEVNFTLYKTGGITIGADTWMQVELGETATPYEPSAMSANSLSSLLLGVGTYADAQDIIKGNITRKVGIKVLDGSETIGISNKVYTIAINDKVKSKTSLLCSHCAYSSLASSTCPDYSIISFASQNIGIRYDACADVETFRQFLHREYAKGTPVIVVYPLATEKTESVTPVAVSNPKGEVTIIRDAEVKALAMEATIKVKSEGGEIEFYLDHNGNILTFKAREGMTWLEWCASAYNTDGYYCEGEDYNVWTYTEGDSWFPTSYWIAGVTGKDKVQPKTYTEGSDGIGGGGGGE